MRKRGCFSQLYTASVAGRQLVSGEVCSWNCLCPNVRSFSVGMFCLENSQGHAETCPKCVEPDVVVLCLTKKR